MLWQLRHGAVPRLRAYQTPVESKLAYRQTSSWFTAILYLIRMLCGASGLCTSAAFGSPSRRRAACQDWGERLGGNRLEVFEKLFGMHQARGVALLFHL